MEFTPWSRRSYHVKINDELSARSPGKCFGPILFNCVMSVLLIISGYWYWMSSQCHTNAEDTRFLVNYNETEDFNDEETARGTIKQAFGLISKFMSENHQKIKSEEEFPDS